MSRSIPESIPLDDILETLDLSRAEPGVGFLRALFARFNAQVPFETASKIVLDVQSVAPQERPMSPETFWRRHLEFRAGGIGFERVAAFRSLLEALGFRVRAMLGRVERDFDHAAVAVIRGTEEWICDVGFPLPVLLPARSGSVETGLGEVWIEATERGFQIELLGGVPEGPRRIELFGAAVSEGEFAQMGVATSRFNSDLRTDVTLRRQEGERIISFSRGEVRIDDAHSRLAVPLPAPRAARLTELFGIDAGILTEAFSRVGDPDSSAGRGRLVAYLETRRPPAEAFSAIASPESYARLAAALGKITTSATRRDRWTIHVTPEEDSERRIEDEVIRIEPSQELRVRRLDRSFLRESAWRVERRADRTYLVRETILPDSGETLLRNDSMRGRLAGALAADLLAWTRLLARDSESGPGSGSRPT
jgi:hypothetical protein